MLRMLADICRSVENDFLILQHNVWRMSRSDCRNGLFYTKKM